MLYWLCYVGRAMLAMIYGHVMLAMLVLTILCWPDYIGYVSVDYFMWNMF